MRESIEKKDFISLWPKTIRISRLQALAQSLISYAAGNDGFSRRLEFLITENFAEKTKGGEDGFIVSPYLPEEKVGILLPENESSALRRAEWTVERMREKEMPGYAEARQLFQQWVKDKEWEGPKQIVVGVLVVAIPGITLGKFSRRKESMSVLIREDYLPKVGKGPGVELTAKIASASHGVMFKALTAAQGNLNKIPPETLEWYAGDRKLSFLKADSEEIQTVHDELKDLEIDCSAVNDESGIAILALSPEVNEDRLVNSFESF